MKKQIVTACALIASVAAFATSVTSENTFGVLKIDVSSTAKEVVVPVPWAAVGSGDASVKVVDFILANGRVKGDTLYWFDASSGHYKVWTADGSGAWNPETTIKVVSEGVETLAASDDDTIARGQAAILVLKAAGEGNGPVYLNGQYSTATATTTIYGLTQEESETLKSKGFSRSTLIAAPKAAACNLNADLEYYDAYTSEENKVTLSKAMVGDKIMVFGGSNYTYGSVSGQNKWYKVVGGNRSAEDCTIPMGTGAWYIRNNVGDFVIKWN